MTSIALGFASVSLLSRGKIAIQIHDRHFELKSRNVPALYMAFFVITEVACVAFGCYAAQQLAVLDPLAVNHNGDTLRKKNPFIIYTIILLFIQAAFVIYSGIAAVSRRIQRHPWVTFTVAFITFAVSLVFMFWAHGYANVGVNFGDWSYGQTFNATAGCAGFAATFVGWLCSGDSAAEK
jgi:heme/copper-type cytochrome/quinol oxidase subunit 3